MVNKQTSSSALGGKPRLGILGWLTQVWRRYTGLIKQNCDPKPSAIRNMQYWRDNLFAGTLIYVFPLSLIGLIPGLYWNIYTNDWVLVAVDISVMILLSAVAFLPRMRIAYRKRVFILFLQQADRRKKRKSNCAELAGYQELCCTSTANIPEPFR